VPDPRHESMGPDRRLLLADRLRTHGRGAAQDVRQDRLECRLDPRDDQRDIVGIVPRGRRHAPTSICVENGTELTGYYVCSKATN